MQAPGSGAGLNPRFASPPPGTAEIEEAITEEAGLRPPRGQSFRITALVEEGAVVAEGAPLACLRDAPDVCFAAPMPGRVARIVLHPGRRLSEIVLFREAQGDRHRHDTGQAATAPGLRRLIQRAGGWPLLRRRPFGGMPAADEQPAAIFVMAADTRPFAPDPRQALADRTEDFARGLQALAVLTEGPVFVCDTPGPALFDPGALPGRLRRIPCGPRHPQGSAGIRIHADFPAGIETPVWDIHAEDVAALGELLATGHLPMTRLVRVAGAGLRRSRLVRTQIGADMRGLCHRVALPGPYRIMSGSPLDGFEAHWLAPRDRQVTVLPREAPAGARHWLTAALTRSARPAPVIPTAALTQALGAALPASVLVRALSAGDDEGALRLGLLSLLEEDLALADYVLGGETNLAGLLRAMLDRIRAEVAA